MTEYKLINLLGNPLTVVDDYGHRTRIQAYGRTRVRSTITVKEEITVNGVTVPLLELGDQEVEGLPDPEPGVLYIVDGLQASVAQRDDVIAPSRVTREGNKKIECKAFLTSRQRSIISE